MAIKETPISYKQYYKSMREYADIALNDVTEERNKRIERLNILHDKLSNDKLIYKSNFNFNLDDYEEFLNNEYSTGSLLRVAKIMYTNRTGNYELVSDLYDLYMYALLQKEIYDFNKQINLYSRMTTLTLKEYLSIIKTFYTEVQKELILNGKGYVFEEHLGWICVNRYKVRTRRKTIDFAATKKREAELKAEGKRIYNKDEAEWCAKNGIEYKAEDKRVFLNNEYQYEIPLINCRLPNGDSYKLERADYRGSDIRGKTNQTLLEECNYDKNKIMELNLDIKAKLLLCVEADKMLYMNFIRTPNETPLECKSKRKI